MTKNQIDYARLKEEQRHNIVTEALSDRDVSAKELTAATGFGSLNETIRHNQTTEAYSYANLDELRRHNVSLENVNWYEAESDRKYKENQASIGFMNAQTQQSAQLEAIRHNTAVEAETAQANRNKEYENYRSNVANESIEREYKHQLGKESEARVSQSWANLSVSQNQQIAQEQYWHDSIEAKYYSDFLDFAGHSLGFATGQAGLG